MSNLTLEEIAKQAGVSRSTVSRVINHQPYVRAEVRQRVEAVIQQTQFQPNVIARSLASQRSHMIGLVLPRRVQSLFIDPYFPSLIQGIVQGCNHNDYTLSLFLFDTEDQERQAVPRIARGGLLDGVIVQAAQTDDELIARFAGGELPFVVAGKPISLVNSSFVDVDNTAGAYTAVVHLIRLGYRRIGTVCGALNTAVGIERLEGYRQALADRGLPALDELVAEGDYSELGGYYAVQRLLPQRPDALFVASDTMALGALRALREANLAVPQDVAIVGFDDLPPAQRATPALTTVRQPVTGMGVTLVETLLDIIENGPYPPRHVILGTTLVIRESCGANQAQR